MGLRLQIQKHQRRDGPKGENRCLKVLRPLPAVAGSKGTRIEARGEKEKPSDALHQQAENRFEQAIGLSHGYRQSLPLLQGLKRGPTTKINGLFYWVVEDSLIRHEVAKAAGLESHGAANVEVTPFYGTN
jgi:hypothetical protein